MTDNYVPIRCDECDGLVRVAATFWCQDCGKTFEPSDWEVDVFVNPQWRGVLEMPEMSSGIIQAVHDATGLALRDWHMGGGCMALGVVLPDGMELIVTDGDANLPGRYDDELHAAIRHPEDDGDDCPEYHAPAGDPDVTIGLIEFIRKHI